LFTVTIFQTFRDFGHKGPASIMFNSVACSTAKRKASYSANRDKTFCESLGRGYEGHPRIYSWDYGM